MKPAIIVVTYNRPLSLKRLLRSLARASYPVADIPLIISIDYQNSVGNKEVKSIAEGFNWKFGKKTVIAHSSNLGLKKHVISCGDLIEEYDSLIMLEDDLFVSPHFYSYSIDTLSYYQSSEKVGGISLYTHRKNISNQIPFEPIPDSNDVLFLQLASSWGQAWTKAQWQGFREWYNSSHKNENEHQLPPFIRNWPKSSWLKEFNKYLLSKNKFFVYPIKSLSTNFGDSGTHNTQSNNNSQVSLFHGDEPFKLVDIENSINVYDPFFELLPSKLKHLTPQFEHLDFTVDLYGLKELRNISSKFLISSKKIKVNTRSTCMFKAGLSLKPIVLNIAYEMEGEIFKFYEKDAFVEGNQNMSIQNPLIFNFFFGKLPIKTLTYSFVQQLKYRFFLKTKQ